jgi:hypothetical protein
MPAPDETRIEAFAVKDCALIALATGRRAQNLRELRDHVRAVDEASLYYHFWGARLRPQFDDPEYNNDFAGWARHALHDWTLAERLAVVDPTETDGIEGLRQEVLEILEERLDEVEHVAWARSDQQFHFLTSQIVVFDTHARLTEPAELATALPRMTVGSVFYHTIDARRRHPGRAEDFSLWLAAWGPPYDELRRRLAEIDPFFSTLAQLREDLVVLFLDYFHSAAA